MTKVPELFGNMVFNERVMREKLPKDVYQSVRQSMEKGAMLPPALANIVATAMKDWAVERGATHYTHWFQPMTGITAEKHESFIAPTGDGGVIMEFSGKELIKGEPDASSFPSGGLRATFEARGYTNWDPTSYAFIKEGVLCIPTAFCSYTGEALDKKTPLLRSMAALNRQALRVLRLFGVTAQRVVATVGVEQEYFLIDREAYNKRKDLIFTGRTLFGAMPPKGQEMDDHYFGNIRIRVSAYMHDLDEELWKLGILAKTQHNEVAPAQHELAPIFTTVNVAVDHNQLTMEIMRKVAKRHGLTCLLQEKPFAGVNGSGKHNNWSLVTDAGVNLLEPGDTPAENAQFLLFLCAVIKAVDEYQELLRISVSTAGNDHRLGGNEAPPAIVSIFVGDELGGVLDALESGVCYSQAPHDTMNIGADVLPSFPKDTTDRNRTSPFAFTGNKFEFRMPGSALSMGDPNTVLNTIVAESLRQFADTLEQADDFAEALNRLIRETIRSHKRVLFNGNGYDESWVAEAERRGLSHYRTAPEAIPHMLDEKNVAVMARHHVLSAVEMRARCEIMLENYCKQIHIEAMTMLEMARGDIYPAAAAYAKALAEALLAKRAAVPGLACRAETELISRVSALSDCFYQQTQALAEAAAGMPETAGAVAKAQYYHDVVLARMNELRATADALEIIVDQELWPYPSYGQLMYGV